MRVVNIHEAKTHLLRLIEDASRGEPFIIARASKPLVKMSALAAPHAARRLGFLVGQLSVPDDFDRMGEAEIERLFNDAEEHQ